LAGHNQYVKYVLKLSGEHPTLPFAELKAVMEGECKVGEASCRGRVAFADVESDDHSFISRLAYTLKAAEYIGESGSLGELAEGVYERISDAASFRITSSGETQRRLGKLLCDMGLNVNLKSPEADIWVDESGGAYTAGLTVGFERSYGRRRPQYRPYFHPTSMHPKLARALVNLTRVRVGDVVLDPFCGTGGILIEAGLMGMGVVGGDIDERMADGCRQNLREYGIEGRVVTVNALDMVVEADAIATDPPYGRSSRPSEDTRGLYRKFLSKAAGILKRGDYMSLMLPSDRDVECDGFTVESTFDVRVHKSLTRRVWVLKAV